MTLTKKRRLSSGLGVNISRWPKWAMSVIGSFCMQTYRVYRAVAESIHAGTLLQSRHGLHAKRRCGPRFLCRFAQIQAVGGFQVWGSHGLRSPEIAAREY